MLYRRILITGANGLVGQELVSTLSLHPDFDVLATGRDRESRLPSGSFGYTPLDITSQKEIRNLMTNFTPDVVINCAAITSVDVCERDKQTCWEINVEAVEHLARCCLQHGTKLVHVSTDFVFDGMEGPYRESDRPDPVNFYGKSKLAAENAVRKAGLQNWAIARTVLVYGTGNLLSRSNFALWVIDQLSKGNTIRVVDDQWRSPTYAPDLAQGLHKLVRYDKRGVYHLSGREFLSVHEFALKIATIFDLDASLIKPIDSVSLNQPAVRPPKTGFIILKAETEFGYRPRSLENGLAHLGARLGLPVTTS